MSFIDFYIICAYTRLSFSFSCVEGSFLASEANIKDMVMSYVLEPGLWNVDRSD